jgi:hypothetical protein
MTKVKYSFGKRLSDGGTVARRFLVPRYVVSKIREISPPYGSQGRAIQVGMELLSRIQYHPIPINENLKRGVSDPDGHSAMTYKLLPRTAEMIDSYAEIYETRGRVFEALLTLISRKFIA